MAAAGPVKPANKSSKKRSSTKVRAELILNFFTFIVLTIMLQVSQSQESPLLSSPHAAATDPVKPADKSAKKRSGSKVSRFNIEILSRQ